MLSPCPEESEVYSGLLPITKDEASLAVVIGHEIGHVVAKHANERISQQLALQYGGAVAGELLKGVAANKIGQTVFGLGAQVGVMLPYARKQEYEADELGLIFMAMAGYDPRVAIPFWTRMAQSSKGGKIPEFLSTHPTVDKRISNMEKILPKALKYCSLFNRSSDLAKLHLPYFSDCQITQNNGNGRHNNPYTYFFEGRIGFRIT